MLRVVGIEMNSLIQWFLEHTPPLTFNIQLLYYILQKFQVKKSLIKSITYMIVLKCPAVVLFRGDFWGFQGSAPAWISRWGRNIWWVGTHHLIFLPSLYPSGIGSVKRINIDFCAWSECTHLFFSLIIFPRLTISQYF